MPGAARRALLLASWCVVGGAAGSDMYRVKSRTTGLQHKFHAWVLVDEAAYAALNGMNFTCSGAMMGSPLSMAGTSLLQSHGCWTDIAQVYMPVATPGCKRNAMAGMTDFDTTQGGFFLEMGRSYAVCGLSFWNDFFAFDGSVEFYDDGASLVSFDSMAAYMTNAGGVSKSACLSPKGRRCAFDMGTILVGGSGAVDCSAAPDCAALNRLECSTGLTANTCGGCKECFLVAQLESGSGASNSSNQRHELDGPAAALLPRLHPHRV